MTINNTTIANSIDVAANARASSFPFVDEFKPRDPTTSDIQYPIQKKWLNTTTNAFWELKNFNSNSGITTANWVLISNSGAGLETLTGDDGIIVPPTNNNIDVLGDGIVITTTGNAATSTLTIHGTGEVATEYVCDVGSAIPAANILNVLGGNGETTTGSGNTITIDYWSLTPYMVGADANSQYVTIQSAITQAIADGASFSNPKNIYIKPKSAGYTENPVVADGINLIGFGTQTTIHGKITFSTAGVASLNNLIIQTNSDFAILMGGSSSTVLACRAVNVNCTNNIGISYTNSNAGSVIAFLDCSLNVATAGLSAYSMSSPGAMLFLRSDLQNTGITTTSANNSAGTILWQACVMSCPHSTSGTGSVSISQCRFDCMTPNATCITTSGTAVANVFNSELLSGTSSCMVIGAGTSSLVSHVCATSSNTNVFTGGGNLNYAFISFGGASSGHNVAVETPLVTL